MTIPKHFCVTDESEKLNFIRMNSFGQLASCVDGQIFATPLPLLLSADEERRNVAEQLLRLGEKPLAAAIKAIDS